MRSSSAVVEAGDHGSGEHARGDAGFAQAGDGGKAALRRSGAGLHAAGEFVVERGDGQPDPDQAAFGHAGEELDVAEHARGLGHDAGGMAVMVEDFQDGAGEAQGPLDGLVGVGVGAEGDRAGDVAGLGELALELFGDVGLEGEAGFEVEAGGQAEPGVAGTGVAIDAAVLAAAIRVHRAVEAEVGGFVVAERGPAAVAGERGGDGRRGEGFVAGCVPAVVEGFGRGALVAVGHVDRSAPALSGAREFGADRVQHGSAPVSCV